ncbi:tyrosine-protein kinase PR2-like [Centruroides sculpturatus]|uniref:tyrosine-protein kinase PR2-like n=1 Tax=Centruroides sculpturatus TaxID=218467 RepID=UPI000C6CA45C|nr:tyrosine-protein kinase PR2-like [Centruroides sculpturatus]
MDSTNKGPSLYEFLMEAELSHYYNSLKTDLKVNSISQLKYVEEEDLLQLGMSKPEQRRLRKFFHKYYPPTYLKKIKKMILPKFKEDLDSSSILLVDSNIDKNVRVPSKHIISADSIVINKELGVGEFGVVEQGVWTNEEGERIQVAIKCLSKERIQNSHMEFLKEAAIMHTIDHEHIVRLYGVVLDTKALMLVTELAPLRSLLECLKEPALRPSFPIISLCDFAFQICDGMQYLESKRLIHRDLAARNILVFAKNKVKISDFGLSRALGVGKDYYQTNFNVNLKLPIAWCAPECINYLRFTSSSDVWAYGVTLWEMFSYGFQPWAALTGQQILEAIDEPNFQRLEQPEYCPKDYYTLMLKCWQHDPNKRPKFVDILNSLPECKPEQVQAVKDYIGFPTSLKLKDWLSYKVGDVITVLDKKPNAENPQLWKGILNNGKTGLFNPANTVAYLGQNLPTNRPSFTRADGKISIYASRRRLCPEMISRPQGDLRHTGHVGLDGAFFGDVSFLGDKYQQLPRQVVAPYKPHEDKEQSTTCLSRNTSEISDRTPLLNKSNSITDNRNGLPTEVWTDVKQEMIKDECPLVKNETFVCKPPPPNYEPEILLPTRRERTETYNKNFDSCMNFKSKDEEVINKDTKKKHKHGDSLKHGPDHEYHEISDEELVASVESPRFEMLDFGPSLMDEVFKALASNKQDTEVDEQHSAENNNNVKNEIKEITSKLIGREGSRKKQIMVKPISATDQHTLDSAIAMAKELASKSMLELEYKSDSDVALESPKTPTSPTKRKFSFKFKTSPKPERRNFSEEAESILDINDIISKEAKEAYNSLVDKGQGLERSLSHPVPSHNSSYQNSNLYGHRNNLQSGIDTVDSEHDALNSNPLRMLRMGGPVRPKVRGNKRSTKHAANTHREIENTHSANPVLMSNERFSDVNNDNERNEMEATKIYQSKSSSLNATSQDSCNNNDNNNNEDSNECYQNPLPLPPRDRTRPPPVLKCHQRKYPLVIPASNDISEIVTVKHSTNIELGLHGSLGQPVPSENKVMNDDENIQKVDTFDGLQTTFPTENCIPPPKPARTCSLNDSFESQIQAVVDSLDDIPEESAPSPPIYNSSDHVSCEDLLEFAMDKPNSKRTQGRARGIDSDEVRIMQKVLAKESITPEDCLFALNDTDWNIHNAIKLARLLRILNTYNINIENSKNILLQCDWNVQQAVSCILATHGSIEDTTEV